MLVLLYGGLVMMFFTILLNPMQVNRKANFFFSIFLFLWSNYWILDVLSLCGFVPSPTFIFFVELIQIFTPILLFYSFVFFANPNYQFQKKDLVCLVVPLIYLIILFNSENNKNIEQVRDFLAVLHNLPYIALIYFRIKKYQKRIENISSNTENINLQWFSKLAVLLLAIIIVTVGYELFNMFVYKLHHHVVMSMLYLLIVYSTSFQVLRQQEIYPTDENERRELLSVELEEEPFEKKKLIPESEFEAMKQKLVHIMENEKPYLDGELNLAKLSKYMDLNAHQLSYLLNEGFGKNFFQFVNTYRIEVAQKLLTNPEHQKLSMVGIAFEAGFNSKTSFNTTFKKLTGKTPSEFRKQQTDL